MKDQLNEKELILKLKLGDESAFKVLVTNYQNKVYNVVLHILHHATDAEDAAHETFIQVYESISGFKEASSLSTWIYKIAIRKALEKIRKQKVRQKLQLMMPWWMPAEQNSIEALWLNPEIKFENKEQAKMIFKAIANLPNNQRIVFTLIRLQGMKHLEVSEIMKLSVKAIESLLTRAKENLKISLSPYKNKS